MSVASFEATNRVATFLTEADDVTNRTLLVNLAVGGVSASRACLLVISTIILFAVAVKEGHGVLTNTPVTFYRCDGMDPNCCANGPHGLGAHPRFTYLNDGEDSRRGRRTACEDTSSSEKDAANSNPSSSTPRKRDGNCTERTLSTACIKIVCGVVCASMCE